MDISYLEVTLLWKNYEVMNKWMSKIFRPILQGYTTDSKPCNLLDVGNKLFRELIFIKVNKLRFTDCVFEIIERVRIINK